MRDALGYAADYGRDVSVVPMAEWLVGAVRTPLLVLLGAVGFIVLIASANVGNLLLVRAAERGREMAVRIALGAGPGAIARQLLIESQMLSLFGAALGLTLGYGGIRILRAMLPPDTPRLSEMALDPFVLLVCTLIAVATGMLFGLAPAMLGARTDPQRASRRRAREHPCHSWRGSRR